VVPPPHAARPIAAIAASAAIWIFRIDFIVSPRAPRCC
jgi:hypothetical protein